MSDDLPPCPDGSVTQWIQEVKRGDITAVEKLWERYFKRLVHLAGRKLRDVPLREADEEDVALIALNSFFDGAKKGRYPRLNDRDDLWSLLASITEHKALKLKARQRAKKRGGGMTGRDVDWENVIAPTNTEFLDELSLQCEELLQKLESDTFRLIAVSVLKGYSNAEVAEMLSMNERSVERKRQIIRRKWATELEA